jgi:ribosomal protein S27AE
MSGNYNKLWPEQARAKWLVQKAVQRGKIKKPPCCQRCGKPFPPDKLQAHHHDYSRPLDVSWYCGPCHKAVHKELGKNWKDSAGFEVTQVICLGQGGGMKDGDG